MEMKNLIGYIALILIFDLTSPTASDPVNAVEETNLHDDDHWIVPTSTGSVEGTVITTVHDLKVYVFYGIPYAEPPTGDLRFKPPEPVKPWTEVLKASKKPLPCYQQQAKASMFRLRYLGHERVKRPWTEDCLTLNIWTPKPKVHDAPVMVVFHPGMFEYGSNNYPDGSILSAKTRDVVVSVNYRLGAFGFLNFGVSGASGNMGLLDQQLAMKWIHENVHHFGGLTKAIILVGAGDAGAASVSYHVLAPESAKLFATIAPFSGSPMCPWAYQEPAESIKNSKSLSQRLGCAKSTTEEELDCLRNVHPEDFIDESTSHRKLETLQILPTVDGTFINDTPTNLLKAGLFKKTMTLSVSNNIEGSLALSTMVADLMPNPDDGMGIEVFRQAVMRIAPTLTKAGLSAVEEYYIDKCHSSPQKIRDAAIRVYSDVLVDCGMNQFVELYAEQGGAAFRCIDDLALEFYPSWVGSSHAISIEYVFGYPFIMEEATQFDKNFTEYIMDWINETTRRKASEMEQELAPYDVKEKKYTYWNITGAHHRSHFRENECKLWKEIIPKLDHANHCGHA